MEGRGIMIFENGEYYIGEFKDNKMHGKGTLYYKIKKIKYKGEFINGKPKNSYNIIFFIIIPFIVFIISFMSYFYIHIHIKKNKKLNQIILIITQVKLKMESQMEKGKYMGKMIF